MKKFVYTILFYTSVIVIPVMTGNRTILAQTDCAFALDKAQTSYEQGVFQNIPEMLLPCMEKGFSKDEKLRAYKLLILTYLFDDKQEKAEQVMLDFLDKYPEYTISPADPVEFGHLFKDFQTIPMYSFGIILGGNFSNAIITQPFGVGDLNTYDGDYKPQSMGFQIGMRVNRFLKDRWEINAEIAYMQNKVQFTSSDFSFSRVTKTETYNSLSIPITGTYDFLTGNINPYLRGGFSADYFFSTSGLFQRTYSESVGLQEVTGPELDLSPNRKQLYISLLLGGGVKYNLSHGYVMFDLRTNIGLYNIVNERNRYSPDSHELIYKYYYVDDDFILNRFYFSVGYIRKLYKTQKR